MNENEIAVAIDESYKEDLVPNNPPTTQKKKLRPIQTSMTLADMSALIDDFTENDWALYSKRLKRQRSL